MTVFNLSCSIWKRDFGRLKHFCVHIFGIFRFQSFRFAYKIFISLRFRFASFRFKAKWGDTLIWTGKMSACLPLLRPEASLYLSQILQFRCWFRPYRCCMSAHSILWFLASFSFIFFHYLFLGIPSCRGDAIKRKEEVKNWAGGRKRDNYIYEQCRTQKW